MPHRGIERGEHLGVGEHFGAREPVEQGRFAGVGVAHQRDGRERHGLPLEALRGASAAHSFEVAFDGVNALVNAAAVGFQFGFARAARADAGAQPRHGRAVSRQSRQQVVQLREFHLQLAFPGSRPAREDVQDQLRPVEHLHVQRPLQIALLGGRQLAVEDHHSGVVQVDQRLQLFDFAGADLGGRIHLRARLNLALGHARARRDGERCQFGERIFRAG